MPQQQTSLPCLSNKLRCHASATNFVAMFNIAEFLFLSHAAICADLWVCSWLWHASANRARRMPKVTAAAVYSYHTTAYAQLATAAHALLTMQLCCSSCHCTSPISLILNTTYRARFVSVGEKMTPSDFERHAGRGAKISTNLHSQCCRHVTKSYPIGMATY